MEHTKSDSRLDEYKSENKRLRRDLHSLKAKHEEMALLMQQSIENQRLKLEHERLEEKLQKFHETTCESDTIDSGECNRLKERIRQLELQLDAMSSNTSCRVDTSSKQLHEDSLIKTTDAAIIDATKNDTDELNNLKQQIEDTDKQNKQLIDDLQQEWNRERTSLREEVRRLNMENSQYRSKFEAVSNPNPSLEDDEEEEWTKRYNLSTCQSKDRAKTMAEFDDLLQSHSQQSNEISYQQEFQYDSSDLSCLQSILQTLRQTIHDLTTENSSLQQRLKEEQTKSHHDLLSFAKTLEGVEDLRSAAERMSRELRRIKMRGCKPTRSELIPSSSDRDSFRNGDFNDAENVSTEMEEAIRLIEGQNDALKERWSSSPNCEDIKVFRSSIPKRASLSSTDGDSISNHIKVLNKDENDDGFMSYWHHDDEEVMEKKKEKKAKEKRKKKKASSNASVFSSFF